LCRPLEDMLLPPMGRSPHPAPRKRGCRSTCTPSRSPTCRCRCSRCSSSSCSLRAPRPMGLSSWWWTMRGLCGIHASLSDGMRELPRVVLSTMHVESTLILGFVLSWVRQSSKVLVYLGLHICRTLVVKQRWGRDILNAIQANAVSFFLCFTPLFL